MSSSILKATSGAQFTQPDATSPAKDPPRSPISFRVAVSLEDLFEFAKSSTPQGRSPYSEAACRAQPRSSTGVFPVSRGAARREDVAVRSPDEEAGHTPLLGGQRLHYLVAAHLCLSIGSLDVVDLD